WFPYPNKTMFFVDLLDSLPRLRLSDAHMQMIIFVLNQCGARDVPSFYALRKFQELLREKCAPATVQHRSVHGNIFYSNDIRDTIAMEFANPQIAPHFHPYPEIQPNGISEAWEASRWREIPRDLLPPMMALGNQHFFLDELAQLANGQFIVPHEWVTVQGARCGLCRTVTFSELTGLATIGAVADLITVPIADFRLTFPELLAGNAIPALAGALFKLRSTASAMPNPLREVADGDELFTVFVNLWADDVSGNVSKQYNKHINIYVSNMGLPAALLQQEYFVRFVSTSPNATAPEQFSAIKEHILDTHKAPRQCYNAVSRRTCKFRIVAQALPGDNPQQSENCSHAGGMSTCHCRRCKNVRRPAEDDGTNAWFVNNFEPGEPRTAAETLRFIEEQFDIACSGVASAVKAAQTATGVRDSIASVWIDKLVEEARRLQSAGKESPEVIAENLMIWLWNQPGDKFHPLLEWAGLDPHSDTPVEILHTILLGIAKYVWYGLHSSWTDAMQALFVIRLQSTDISGLSIPPFRAAYMMQYRNNLIGKHFKALLQTQIFHLHELVSDQQFKLAKSAGALAAHIWFERIHDMDQYLSDLRILIANVLDAFTELDPTRIITKAKLHVLTHLPDDIPRLGPGVRFATEIYECFNAIFRMCSVLSNHQAPSRDIAIALANMDRMKHMISGGFWKEGDEWAQASDDVRRVLQDHPIVQRHFGWAPPVVHIPGEVKPYKLSPADETILNRCEPHVAATELNITHTAWKEGVSVVAEAGDICKVSAWVVHIGRISKIHVPIVEGSMALTKPLIALSRYSVAATLHPDFEMPYLRPATGSNGNKDIVLATNVRFIINVQHDCRAAGCQPTASRAVRQERQETDQQALSIQHASKEYWVMNTHAFHNAVLLRRVLGRNLTAPKLNTPNRDEWLKEKEVEARYTLVTKQQEATAKAAETRARNRLAKQKGDADAAAAPETSSAAEGQVNEGAQTRSRGKKRREDAADDDAAPPQAPSAKRRKQR
ncbi:hypothetical protein AURDEDRAFT_73929, partial [Auricularia subglabra TFB-10046 SS5]